MRAAPREFNYTYVKLRFEDVDSNVLSDIKKKLANNKDVDYVDFDKDDGDLVIFMKKGNPVGAFIEASEGKCDFWSGMNNVRCVKWCSESEPSRLWYTRYFKYTGNDLRVFEESDNKKQPIRRVQTE